MWGDINTGERFSNALQTAHIVDMRGQSDAAGCWCEVNAEGESGTRRKRHHMVGMTRW